MPGLPVLRSCLRTLAGATATQRRARSTAERVSRHLAPEPSAGRIHARRQRPARMPNKHFRAWQASRYPPPAPRSKAKKVKLADEPLAPKKKTQSKVKLAAKAKKAKKRGACGGGGCCDGAPLGLALRPGLLAVPQEEEVEHPAFTMTRLEWPVGPLIASWWRRRGRRRRSGPRAAAAR